MEKAVIRLTTMILMIILLSSGVAAQTKEEHSKAQYYESWKSILESEQWPKGERLFSLAVEAYRFAPQRIERRRIPESLYERIRARPISVTRDGKGAPGSLARPSSRGPGIEVSRELYEMAGFEEGRKVDFVNVR